MKNFNLSLVTILAMSTFAIAGGDVVVPLEAEAVAEPLIVDMPENNNGLYLGLAFSSTGIDAENTDRIDLDSFDTDSIMIQAGYKFNPYIAVEGRYWDGDNGFDAWGVYAKPMYPITESFDVYALLGYGNTEARPMDDMSLDDATFQWGVGTSYAFTDNIAVFIDYVELYSNDDNLIDWSLDTLNIGVTYQF